MLAQVRGGGAGSRAWLPSPGGCHAENACGRCVTGFPEPARPLTGMRCSPGRALCRGCIHTPAPAASPVRWRISLGTGAESPPAGHPGRLWGLPVHWPLTRDGVGRRSSGDGGSRISCTGQCGLSLRRPGKRPPYRPVPLRSPACANPPANQLSACAGRRRTRRPCAAPSAASRPDPANRRCRAGCAAGPRR